MKKKIDVARAWRDEEYYLGLTEEERASLGAHPSGLIEVDGSLLKTVVGGVATLVDTCSAICTPCPPRQCY
ncbi:MAG: mersacidin/lichenicidin family type 2 lantibiotic [Acidobacteriota bacterium]